MDKKELLKRIYESYFHGYIRKEIVTGTHIISTDEQEIVKVTLYGIIFYERRYCGYLQIYSCGDDTENIIQALEYFSNKHEFNTDDEEYQYFKTVLSDNMICDFQC